MAPRSPPNPPTPNHHHIISTGDHDRSRCQCCGGPYSGHDIICRTCRRNPPRRKRVNSSKTSGRASYLVFGCLLVSYVRKEQWRSGGGGMRCVGRSLGQRVRYLVYLARAPAVYVSPLATRVSTRLRWSRHAFSTRRTKTAVAENIRRVLPPGGLIRPIVLFYVREFDSDA